MRMRFTRLTSLYSIPHSIQIHSKLCEITGTKVSASHMCDLESRPKSQIIILKCKVQKYLLDQVRTKSFHRGLSACQCGKCFFFFTFLY